MVAPGVDPRVVAAAETALDCFAELGADVREVHLPDAEAVIEHLANQRDRVVDGVYGVGRPVAHVLVPGRVIGRAAYIARRRKRPVSREAGGGEACSRSPEPRTRRRRRRFRR